MTFKDIGKRSVPFRSYDDLNDPKTIRIVTTSDGAEVRVESPEGMHRVTCPGCNLHFPGLDFFSVDKVSADMNLTCRSCRKSFEIGDCPIEKVTDADQ